MNGEERPKAPRSWLGVPTILSLARIPLAALFPIVVGEPVLSLLVLVLAALSDVLDGWYARTKGQVTAAGAVIDPITDKIFVLTVAVTLVWTERLTGIEMLLLSTREIGELPLVLWLGASRDARRARAKTGSANLPGKIATALQFAAITAALFSAAYLDVLVWATAFAGILAAISYWLRAIRTP